jgi:DNA helicase-2/ATP-dependent DNA helicase PcrA
MGISAVPGSGKTFILELLITELIAQRGIPSHRIGVFTYMRSARANLTNRINQQLRNRGLTVRFTQAFTLHSLALRVLRAYHSRLNQEDLQILEQYEQDRLISRLVRVWLRGNAHLWEPLLPDEDQPLKNRNNRTRFSTSFQAMCQAVIRTAKTYRLAPSAIQAAPRGFLSWAVQIYQTYQAELHRLGKVDYDDLGWCALDLLETNSDILAEVQGWYDYLLEDESQDSSPLQEDLLTLLSQRTGNLVRVGDPNQSIMGTFTTAEPRFFRDFCRHSQQIALDESSRSAAKILVLANRLVEWVNQDHPLSELQDALAPQQIQVASSGPLNPPDSEAAIQFLTVKGSPQQELAAIAQMAIQAVQERPRHTVAVLVSTNEAGARVLMALQEAGFQNAIDLLRNNPTQKRVIETLKLITDYFARPASSARLVTVFEALTNWAGIPHPSTTFATIKAALQQAKPEDLLFPALGSQPYFLPTEYEGEDWDRTRFLLKTLAEWLRAARAPWSDLLHWIVQTLYHTPEDLFIGNYLITQLEQVLGDQPAADWQDIANETQSILGSRLNNLPSEILSFSPAPGSITVTTMHRSKGLEWDEVFLTGLSAYEFPVVFGDRPMGLAFLEETNLQAEALAELKRFAGSYLSANTATEQAFLDLAAEKLRLLYVGVTRAKRRLTLSVSSKTPFDQDQKPSRLFTELAVGLPITTAG